MSLPWVKNFLGLNMPMTEVIIIDNARLELHIHVTLKTIQMGTFVGSLIAAPIAQALSGSKDRNQLKSRMIRYGINGAAIGTVAGPVLTEAWVLGGNRNSVEIYDRCFRIRFNDNQRRVDRCFAAGAVIGGAVAGPAGAVLGVDIGLLSGFLYNMANKYVG